MRETTENYWNLLGEYCAAMKDKGVHVSMAEAKRDLFCTEVESRCEEYRLKYMKEGTDSLDRHKMAAIMVVEGLKLNVIDSKGVDQQLMPEKINITEEKIHLLAALDFLKAMINRAIADEKNIHTETNLQTIDSFSYPHAWACETDFISIISRTLYYARRDYKLNEMELAEKFFLIEYISILQQHPADADMYFSVLKRKEHA